MLSFFHYLALYIDDNANKITFVGLYGLFVALVVPFAPSLRSGTNDTTQKRESMRGADEVGRGF